MLPVRGGTPLCFSIHTMKHLTFRFILILLLGVCPALPLCAQVVLVKDGTSRSSILIDGSNATDWTAATILQDFIQKISGCRLPIVTKGTPRKGDIAIGDVQVNGNPRLEPPAPLFGTMAFSFLRKRGYSVFWVKKGMERFMEP